MTTESGGDSTGEKTAESADKNGVGWRICPDEIGFRRHMDFFSRMIASGVFLIIFGVAVCVAVCGLTLSPLTAVSGGIVVFFCAVAVFILTVAGVSHDRFVKSHPKVENVFEREEVDGFFRRFPIVMASLVSAILLDVVFIVITFALIDAGVIRGYDGGSGAGSSVTNYDASCAVVAAFLAVLSAAVAGLVFTSIQRTKYNVSEYNVQNKNDKTPRSRLRETLCSVTMMSATGIYLLLGFVWSLWHPGWVVFVVGGKICGIINVVLSNGGRDGGDEENEGDDGKSGG